MNKTRFGELIELSVELQTEWAVWRNARKSVTPWGDIVKETVCPLHVCNAQKGQECKTLSGATARHQSRANEYFARIWLDSRATTGAKSSAISSGKYPNG